MLRHLVELKNDTKRLRTWMRTRQQADALPSYMLEASVFVNEKVSHLIMNF